MDKSKFNNISLGKLETTLKALSHRTRLEILIYLYNNPDSNLQNIQKHINSTQQNTSNHITKMMYAKLVLKQQKGNYVLHKLSFKGLKTIELLKNL